MIIYEKINSEKIGLISYAALVFVKSTSVIIVETYGML